MQLKFPSQKEMMKNLHNKLKGSCGENFDFKLEI